ncbi:hypothetical protein EJ05DRAFT_373310 [Pseudovirgaria hyperparasitica]|uniref:Uncharacterized protein n=1 Tax=Pseudovirgaria hyperparasitica TaxID=470096 RepID=A0A6A6W7P8_9PEZI|nr:uncharacterized protein EJ05DRAFT_373310 [Pseudovirgaria hyperparasitica]KAF2757980.1 hypothetical protein EJ05DRAFT_373310 [Pseudovirgaria hyperparasitica]
MSLLGLQIRMFERAANKRACDWETDGVSGIKKTCIIVLVPSPAPADLDTHTELIMQNAPSLSLSHDNPSPLVHFPMSHASESPMQAGLVFFFLFFFLSSSSTSHLVSHRYPLRRTGFAALSEGAAITTIRK